MTRSRSQHLVLVGMMGAGKTSVGRRCAQELARPFIDTDDLVVETNNLRGAARRWLLLAGDLRARGSPAHGRGVEQVIDPLGGKSWKKSYLALRATGRLGVFGMSVVSASGIRGKLRALKAVAQMPKFNPLTLMNKNRGVFGLNLGHMWREGEKVRGWTQEIMRGVAEGWIRPHVDHAFPFDQIAEAHRQMEERKNIGKVVLVP